MQFAKDAGTAESWLYLLKKKDFLLEVNISFHPIYSTSRWLYLASSWLSVVIFCNTLYHQISQWSWSLLSWKAPSKNNRTFFFHTYCYWHYSVTKYNSIVLQVYMLYVHIFLKTNSKVYFVMHALHFMLLKEPFNQCSCQTYLSPNLVISVRLPIVSGISGISLCWRSSDVIWTQFPISAHSKDTVSKEVRLLSNKLAGTVLSAYQQYITAPFDLHFSMLSCTITIFSWLTLQ